MSPCRVYMVLGSNEGSVRSNRALHQLRCIPTPTSGLVTTLIWPGSDYTILPPKCNACLELQEQCKAPPSMYTEESYLPVFRILLVQMACRGIIRSPLPQSLHLQGSSCLWRCSQRKIRSWLPPADMMLALTVFLNVQIILFIFFSDFISIKMNLYKILHLSNA